ncbi:hypothetical protein [Aquimarina algiphila]|uniref:HTH cro/C1-type domain-containing protein n=1 Tax=Aquimarina algiphila TaxID=2047982 RepID=A0A554VA76_9FLAO|nr:hypothetical protein [Aquimarina algiphila]TSE02791.1 hypothetical protein FOF46_30480 [Aquimarina algiphila]
MIFLSKNIKYLCDRENIGKDAFGKLFGLNRGAIGSYIEGKSYPKLPVIQKISVKYSILIDDLINKDLAKGELTKVSNETDLKKLHLDSLDNYSLSDILSHLYKNDETYKEEPILWMYIKLKVLDSNITDDHNTVRKLERRIAEIERKNNKASKKSS